MRNGDLTHLQKSIDLCHSVLSLQPDMGRKLFAIWKCSIFQIGWTDEQTDRKTDRQTDLCIDRHTNRYTDTKRERYMYESINK